jgi:hypothetical protein
MVRSYNFVSRNRVEFAFTRGILYSLSYWFFCVLYERLPCCWKVMRCFLFIYLFSKSKGIKVINHNGVLCYILFIHSVVCLLVGPQSIPKRVLHRVPSNSFSFNMQYTLISLRSFSSCLRFLPRLPATYPYLYFSFSNVFQKAVLRRLWQIQLAFLFNVCRIFFSSLALRNSSSFLTLSVQMILSILLQHGIWKIFCLFLFCFPKCPKFQHHTKLYSYCITLLVSFLNYILLCNFSETCFGLSIRGQSSSKIRVPKKNFQVNYIKPLFMSVY